MATDPIPIARPWIWENEERYVRKAIREGWISSRGRYVDALEEKCAEKLGLPHAVATTNGTSALHLALLSLGIGNGDEVIIPDFCMAAPVFAILYCGAKPVPVDIDETWNVDPLQIQAQLTPQTRAILVVHNYGHPADMRQLSEIARRYGLFIIEDCAEAVGATCDDTMVGQFGDVACFSHYGNKTITTGEGGLLLTRRSEIATKARWKRDMCFGRDDESRFVHTEIGYNYRLTSLQAAFGLAQVEHLSDAIAAKVQIGHLYNEMLADIPGVRLPLQAPWAKHVYWVYPILLQEDFGISRFALQTILAEELIETRRLFSPVHSQPFMPNVGVCDRFSRSTEVSQNGFYLPSFIGLTRDAVARIATVIRGARAIPAAKYRAVSAESLGASRTA